MQFAISSAGRLLRASCAAWNATASARITPEVVGCQHVGRPHAVLQVRQARHLRRVAEPGVQKPIGGHRYLAFAALLRHAPPSRRAGRVRTASAGPASIPLISTPAPDRTPRSAPTPGGGPPRARSRPPGPASTPPPQASTKGRRTPDRRPPDQPRASPAASGLASVSPLRSAAGFMRSASAGPARRRPLRPGRAIRAPPPSSTGAACRSPAAAPPGRRVPAGGV